MPHCRLIGESTWKSVARPELDEYGPADKVCQTCLPPLLVGLYLSQPEHNQGLGEASTGIYVRSDAFKYVSFETQ